MDPDIDPDTDTNPHPDTDPSRYNGKTCLGGGMHCPSAPSSIIVLFVLQPVMLK